MVAGTNECLREASFPIVLEQFRLSSSSIDPGMSSGASSCNVKINKNHMAIEKITAWPWA
jgi:hypothetical protein